MHTLRKMAGYAYTGHINNSSLIVNPIEYSVNNNYSNIFRCPESCLNKQFTLCAWLWCYQSIIKLTQKNSFHTSSTSEYYLWTLIPMNEKVWVVSHSTCCQVLVDYHFEQENAPSIFVGKRLNSALEHWKNPRFLG